MPVHERVPRRRPRGSTRAPMVLARHVCRHAVSIALPLSLRAARHDRRPPRARAWRQTPRRPGTNYDWWQEFSAQASGLGKTFVPVDHRLRRGARQPQRAPRQSAARRDDRRRHRRLAGAVVVPERRRRSIVSRAARPHAVAWVLRRVRACTSGGCCGSGRSPGSSYGFLFRLRARLDLRRGIRRLTHDVTVERTAFAIRLGCYVVFGALLVAVNRDLRLRAHPHRRRGSAERDWRARSAGRGSCGATRGVVGLYLPECRSIPRYSC